MSALVFYVFFWLVRINGCIRRGRQPLLRGPGWFFDVRVGPGFYDGPGKRLLRRYWMRMLIPFAVDIPIAIWIFASGRLVLVNWLVLGLCVLIHANHAISVDVAERQARPFAIEGPVGSMMLSLTPRRLRQYANWRFELVLIVTTISVLIWRHDLRAHWKAVAIVLYLQMGFVYLKHLVVAWRTPVPREQAEEHMAVQEARRRYYLTSLDWGRALLTVTLIVSMPFGLWLTAGVVATILVEIKRKQLVRMAMKARPVRLPDLLHQAELARWPVCYQPSAPLLMLKGARGYSINLANTCAVLGLGYVAGFVLLGRVL